MEALPTSHPLLDSFTSSAKLLLLLLLCPEFSTKLSPRLWPELLLLILFRILLKPLGFVAIGCRLFDGLLTFLLLLTPPTIPMMVTFFLVLTPYSPPAIPTMLLKSSPAARPFTAWRSCSKLDCGTLGEASRPRKERYIKGGW